MRFPPAIQVINTYNLPLILLPSPNHQNSSIGGFGVVYNENEGLTTFSLIVTPRRDGCLTESWCVKWTCIQPLIEPLWLPITTSYFDHWSLPPIYHVVGQNAFPFSYDEKVTHYLSLSACRGDLLTAMRTLLYIISLANSIPALGQFCSQLQIHITSSFLSHFLRSLYQCECSNILYNCLHQFSLT